MINLSIISKLLKIFILQSKFFTIYFYLNYITTQVYSSLEKEKKETTQVYLFILIYQTIFW